MDRQKQEALSLLDDRQQLIGLVTKLLLDILSETKDIPRQPSPFDCKQVPAISIHQYLKRIAKYSNCSNSVLVVALVYIDRFQQRIQNFIINYFNIHRLLISCMMLAAKYLDDFYYKNQFYAKIGGISKLQINTLELTIMTTFDFRLHIQDQEFNSYLERLQTYQHVNL